MRSCMCDMGTQQKWLQKPVKVFLFTRKDFCATNRKTVERVMIKRSPATTVFPFNARRKCV